MWQKSQISSIKPEFVMTFVNSLTTHFMNFLVTISWNVSETFTFKVWAGAVVSDFVTDCFNPHASLCSKCPCLDWINILNAPWVRISPSFGGQLGGFYFSLHKNLGLNHCNSLFIRQLSWLSYHNILRTITLSLNPRCPSTKCAVVLQMFHDEELTQYQNFALLSNSIFIFQLLWLQLPWLQLL